MAASSRGARLTEQHRREQQQVKQAFLVEFLTLWGLLDPTRLDETGPGWVQAVLRLIPAFRLRSADRATGYFEDFRAAEVPSAPLFPAEPPRVELPQVELPTAEPQAQRPTPEVIPEPRQSRVRFDFDESAFAPRPQRQTRIEIPDIDWSPSDRAAQVSLIVTGPVGQKAKAKRGTPLLKARDESLVEASGAASRHVLTGGRQSLLTLLENDPQALGWARVTDGDPCAFCALLASRGPVYGSEATAAFQAHDGCACTAEPVYSRQSPWPGRAAEFRRLYRTATRGTSGQDSISAFRRAYEQQQRDARSGQVA